METKKVVTVMGMGYVGFPLACAIARSQQYIVYGYDIDEKKISAIARKTSPVQDTEAEKDIKEVTIIWTTQDSCLAESDYIIVCVPTPVLEDKTPDLGPIVWCVKTIAKNLKKGQYIVIESTINPGVCDEVIIPILEQTGLKLGIDFEVAHCPERINPGDTKRNVYNIPRNFWASTVQGTKQGAEFYRSFINAPINEMRDIKHTEATKIIENTFRDINIAYVNELAKSFDVLGLDIVEVIKGASNKPFAFMAHYPSCGVGWHCIPVDPYYLIERAKQAWFEHKFLSMARSVNNSMPEYTIEKLAFELNNFSKSIKGSRIGLLGLSYKKDIWDLRESPAQEIKKLLQKYQADLHVYDPFNLDESTEKTLDEVLSKSEAIVIWCDHTEFIQNITPELLSQKWIKLVIDWKNCLDKNSYNGSWIVYKWIGR